MLSASYALWTGLMKIASPNKRAVTGFDGAQSQAGFDIELRLDKDPEPLKLIVTKLKDSYNHQGSLLGTPQRVLSPY